MQRKVTKGRSELAAKLAGIRGGKLILVFGGRKGEQEASYGDDPEVSRPISTAQYVAQGPVLIRALARNR